MTTRITGLLLATALAASGADLYISPTGSDTGTGTQASPFATLTRARNEIRALRLKTPTTTEAFNVWVRGGTYTADTTLVLSSQDSGTASTPVTYAAYPGEVARFTGGKAVPASAFSPVTSASPAWGKIPAEVRGKVLVANLKTLGIIDYGSFVVRGYGLTTATQAEFVVSGRPGVLAQWPNQGSPLSTITGTASTSSFTVDPVRAARWSTASGAWVHGFFGNTWADYHLPVASISTATVTLTAPPPRFGIVSGQPFYIYNLLEELDAENEYYIDRTAGLLYYLPPQSGLPSDMQVTTYSVPVIKITGANYVVVKDLTFEASRSPFITIDSGTGNAVKNCLLRSAGTSAIIVNGTSNVVDNCEIVDTGAEGIVLSGGDRVNLVPSLNTISNSRIHRNGRVNWTYRPGVSITRSCGAQVLNNLIDDSHQAGIVFDGNNNRIEGNELRDLCREVSDAGAIYTAGDWSYRGNIIRRNYIHDIYSNQAGNGVHGVFFDMCTSGALIEENVFFDIANVGVMANGGRDLIIRNNVFAKCGIAHFNNDTARLSTSTVAPSFYTGLFANSVAYQGTTWAKAYPELAAIPNTWAQVLTGNWRSPQGCVFDGNIGWQNTAWMTEKSYSGLGVFSFYKSITGNNEAATALFTDEQGWDRNSRPDTIAIPSGLLNFKAMGRTLSLAKATTAPTAPRIEEANLSDFHVYLKWVDDSNMASNQETRFLVQTKTLPDGDWMTVRTLGSDTNNTTLWSLAPSSNYLVRVVAQNDAGQAISNPIPLTTTRMIVPLVPIRYEAEYAAAVVTDLSINGKVQAFDALLDSDQSLQMYDAGDIVEFSFTSGADPLVLSVRLRSGGAVNSTVCFSNGYAFELDGVPLKVTPDYSSVSALDPSYGKCYWGTVKSDNLTLTAGAHKLRVISKQSWMVLDYLEITPSGNPVVKSYDDWVALHFSRDQQANFMVETPFARPVGDSFTNLWKYATGLDPWTFTKTSGVSATSTGTAIDLALTHVGGLVDVDLFAEFSNDGVNWTSYPFPKTSETGISTTDHVMDVSGVTHKLARVRASSASLSSYSEVFNFDSLAMTSTAPVLTNAQPLFIDAESGFTIVADSHLNSVIGVNDAKLDNNKSLKLYDKGDEVSYGITIQDSGYYIVRARTISGGKNAPTYYWPNGIRLAINGKNIGLVGNPDSLSTFDSCYGGCFWGTLESSPIFLTAGNAQINVLANQSWQAVDYVQIVPVPAGSVFLNWSLANFTEDQRYLVTTNPLASFPSDGISNLVRSVFGIPTNAPFPSTQVSAQFGQGLLAVTYQRVAGAVDCTFVTEYTNDGNIWLQIPDTDFNTFNGIETVVSSQYLAAAPLKVRVRVQVAGARCYSPSVSPAALAFSPLVSLVKTTVAAASLTTSSTVSTPNTRSVTLVEPPVPAAHSATIDNLSVLSKVSKASGNCITLSKSTSTSAALLARCVGESLAPFGIADTASDTTVKVTFGSNSTLSNDDSASTLFSSFGAFPLLVGSKDAALTMTLLSGDTTISGYSKSDEPRFAIVEAYLGSTALNVGDAMTLDSGALPQDESVTFGISVGGSGSTKLGITTRALPASGGSAPFTLILMKDGESVYEVQFDGSASETAQIPTFDATPGRYSVVVISESSAAFRAKLEVSQF